MYQTHKINFHLPQSWNACTTSELEVIAATMIKHSLTATKWTPISFDDIKVELFFLLTRIHPISLINPRVAVEEQYFECEKTYHSKCAKWKEDMKVKFGAEDYRQFNIYVWQVNSWMEKYMKWLNADSTPLNLTKFPYPIMKVGLLGKEFHGPSALLQDFSWKRFRFAQEYMDAYVRAENNLLYMQKHSSKFSNNDIIKQCKYVDLIRSQFLATIYCAKTKYVDEKTKNIVSDYVYVSNQHSDNAKYFRNFDVIQWQVITFWWTGMMTYLSQTYKHVYKKQKLNSKDMTNFNPLSLYVCSMATMEKYLGLSEDTINEQTFHISLQHMENMAKENEEFEKSRSK